MRDPIEGESADRVLKPLVSVEFQTEVDLTTGRPNRRMFVKMYFDARDSGLLADIGDRRWRTLCALATYIDEKGCCYPSQARIAKDLGIRRQRVNERIQELLAYRFQGRPVINVRKARLATQNGGRWANNVYEILPVTGFQIFDAARSESSGSTTNSPYVRKSGHRPMSGTPDTGNPDTNQNYGLNKTVNVSVQRRSDGPEGHRQTDHKVQAIAHAILDICRDEHSMGSYLEVARSYPRDVIFEALSLTKVARARGAIRKSAGAFFTDTVTRLARERRMSPPA